MWPKISPEALLFIAGAALSWGVYVPLVHDAQTGLGSRLRAFLFVGVAYLIVAVIIPAVMIFVLKTDPTVVAGKTPNFGGKSVAWGLAAGLAGAIGALCVIFATSYAGREGLLYVAPLVFAGAPIINTLATTYYFHPVKTSPDWRFYLGLGFAIIGAGMVMIYKPTDAKPTGGPPAGNPPAAVTPAAH
jgi:hypothetical protein